MFEVDWQLLLWKLTGMPRRAILLAIFRIILHKLGTISHSHLVQLVISQILQLFDLSIDLGELGKMLLLRLVHFISKFKYQDL